MYQPESNQQTLSEFGFDVADFDDEVDVWIEHEQAVDLFVQMQTQWRTSFDGIVGLDYSVLFQLMDLQNIETDKRLMIFEQIQIMEHAALAVIYEDKS